MRRFAVLATLSTIAALMWLPGTASATGIISALSLSPTTVEGGASSLGTVTLLPDTTRTTVVLFSSDPSVATVPSSVVAPGGQDTVTFPIATNAAAAPTIVQITAAIQNVPRSADLSVNPATPPGPALSKVSVRPSTLTGASPATGTVHFDGAPDGAIVSLSSSDTSLVQVPAEAGVNSGGATGDFAVTTSAVNTTTTATITATWFGITRTTTLTLTPGAPAPPDRVKITTATWKARLLTIEATSTKPSAILSVYSRSGGYLFTLTNQGGGTYFDQRGYRGNLRIITVRSNLGGSATKPLNSQPGRRIT